MKTDKNNYSEEYVKKHRTFPTANTVWLVLCVILQVAAFFLAVTYDPQPQDVIKEYRVTVEPREDGKLDIEYHFVWQALDPDEPLTWVEIGMPNRYYTIDKDSVSNTVADWGKVSDGDYVGLRLDFAKPYRGGETLTFSFKITQGDMLCRGEDGYFHEFVPGWFNTTPIEKYEFRWKQIDGCTAAKRARTEDGYYVWSGRLDCGGYKIMRVDYSADAFEGAETVKHFPFDDEGAYNQLREDKIGVTVLAIVFICAMIVAEVYIIDSYVSYSRGRGFLVGYGHRVHVYGRSNPHYVRARNKHNASRNGGGGSRGCACACACACAGGGRAGCSQKDSFSTLKQE